MLSPTPPSALPYATVPREVCGAAAAGGLTKPAEGPMDAPAPVLGPPGWLSLPRDSRASSAGFRGPDTPPRPEPARAWLSKPSPRSLASDLGDAAREGLCLRDRAFWEGSSKVCKAAVRSPLDVDGPAAGAPIPPFLPAAPPAPCVYCPFLPDCPTRAACLSGSAPGEPAVTDPSHDVLADCAEVGSPLPAPSLVGAANSAEASEATATVPT